MQTRRHSALEAAANIVVGYIGAVGSQMILFPLFGISVSHSTNLLMGGWFTAISIVRSFTLRRLFSSWEDVNGE